MSKNNSIFLMQYNGYELYRNGNTFEISDDNLYIKNNEVFYQDWIDDPFERAEARGEFYVKSTVERLPRPYGKYRPCSS